MLREGFIKGRFSRLRLCGFPAVSHAIRIASHAPLHSTDTEVYMAFVTSVLKSTADLAKQDFDHCGSNDRRVEHSQEPAIWKTGLLADQVASSGCRTHRAHGKANRERGRSTSTKILPVSYASQHDPLTWVDVSLQRVPGRACQTTRRGCAWPFGTQPDVRLPANRIIPSHLQGRLSQFYEP